MRGTVKPRLGPERRKHAPIRMMMALLLLATSGRLLAAGEGAAQEEDRPMIRIARNGSQPTAPGLAEFFTGEVRLDQPLQAETPGRVGVARVTFEPGARTKWHTHPAGQILIVVSGAGWVAEDGGPVLDIFPGDVVWFPAGVKHWHGAKPDAAMAHIAVTESVDGSAVTWLEPVADQDYRAGLAAAPLRAMDEALALIAAFTARGDMDKLRAALAAGLDAGLTVNEIKEALAQLYAYAGFPRCLNGLAAFMEVLEERQRRGVVDKPGPEGKPLPPGVDRDALGAATRAAIFKTPADAPPAPYQTFAPMVDQFLKEHLFGEIFARGVLGRRERELVTIAALASLDGLGGQLRAHYAGGMNVGWTEAQLRRLVAVLSERVGQREGEAAGRILDEVVQARAIAPQ